MQKGSLLTAGMPLLFVLSLVFQATCTNVYTCGATESVLSNTTNTAEYLIVRVADQTTVAVTCAGKTYTWGHNDDGMLGANITSTSHVASSPLEVKGLENVVVVQVALFAGWDTNWNTIRDAAVLLNDGRVFGWGHWMGTTYAVEVPELVGVNVKFLSTGFAIATNGSVYHWGSIYGELRTNPSDPYTPEYSLRPILATALASFTDIDQICGNKEYAGMFLTSTGAVYTWGMNGLYAALGTNGDPDGFVQANLNGTLGAHIECGQYSAYVRTTNNRVFSWGNGELGFETSDWQVSTPTPIPAFEGVQLIDLKTTRSWYGWAAAVTSSNVAYYWGNPGCGIPAPSGEYSVKTPTQVTSLPSGFVPTHIGVGFTAPFFLAECSP